MYEYVLLIYYLLMNTHQLVFIFSGWTELVYRSAQEKFIFMKTGEASVMSKHLCLILTYI